VGRARVVVGRDVARRHLQPPASAEEHAPHAEDALTAFEFEEEGITETDIRVVALAHGVDVTTGEGVEERAQQSPVLVAP
jgi:hypothetical protein